MGETLCREPSLREETTMSVKAAAIVAVALLLAVAALMLTTTLRDEGEVIIAESVHVAMKEGASDISPHQPQKMKLQEPGSTTALAEVSEKDQRQIEKSIQSASEALAVLTRHTKNLLANDLSPQAHKKVAKAKAKKANKAKTRATLVVSKTTTSMKEAKASKVAAKVKGMVTHTKKLLENRKSALREAKAVFKVAAGPTAKKAARKVVKKLMKVVRSAKKKHEKAKAQVKATTGGPLGVCKAGCARKDILEYKATCEEQCLKTDYVCMWHCAQPLRQCECKCHSSKIWTCEGTRCDCWELVGQADGPVSHAMMQAENAALAEGLSKASAEKAALAAQKKFMATPSKEEQIASAATRKKEALLTEATRSWMHSVL